MRVALALFLAAASSANAQNATAAAALLAALNGLGLSSLVSTITSIQNTTVGKELVTTLTTGGPFTVLAPNNNAFKGVPANISSKPDLLSEILSYHVLPGTYTPASFSNTSNTVGLTALNSSDLVFLGPGNQHQALAARLINGKINILNQNTPTTVLNTSTSIPNITVHVVDAVIDTPGDLADYVFANKLNSFKAAAQSVPGLWELLQFQHGVTIFAPTDAAFATALQALGANATNATIIGAVLSNHVVNGSTLYSPVLTSSTKATSAGGEPFTFGSNSTGVTVSSGNSTAKVTVADGLLWNGVVHIIDTVLANTQNNTGAASSAFASATASAASASQTAPGPIGGGPSGASGTGTGAGASSTAKTGGALRMDFPVKSGLVGLVVVLGSILGGALVVV